MKKRIIALLLSLVMLTSLLTPTALATEGQEPETTQEETVKSTEDEQTDLNGETENGGVKDEDQDPQQSTTGDEEQPTGQDEPKNEDDQSGEETKRDEQTGDEQGEETETPDEPEQGEETETPEEPEEPEEPECTCGAEDGEHAENCPLYDLAAAYPPISGEASYEGVKIIVNAPAGAFPAGTYLSVTPVVVEKDQMLESIQTALENTPFDSLEEGEQPFSADIAFKTPDGVELQPREGYPVDVRFELPSERLTADTMQVFHVSEGEDGMKADLVDVVAVEAEEPVPQTQTVELAATSFSIYAVASKNPSRNATKISANTEFKMIVNGPESNAANGTPGTTWFYWGSDYNSSNYGTGDNYTWTVNDPNGTIAWSVDQAGGVTGNIKKFPWIKVTAVKPTPDGADDAELTLTYYPSWGRNTQKFKIHVDAPEFYILDTIAKDGCLTAIYNGNDKVESYEWNRSSGTINQDAFKMADNGNKAKVNVAIDRGGISASDLQAKTYTVTGKKADGTGVGTATFTVLYGNEVLNGGFETPSTNGSHAIVVANGYEGLYWKTTAPGTGEQLGKDIEIINPFEDSNGVDKKGHYGASKAAEGSQAAELNAEAAGALYQDILTAPGADLSWSLNHRARYMTEYDSTSQKSVKDTMYVVIASTKEAQVNYISEEQLRPMITSVDRDGNNLDGSVEYTYGSGDTEIKFRIWKITSDAAEWHQWSGTYKVPANQYLTRFFFVAGDTYYEKHGHEKNKTVGNLIDGVSFSSAMSYTIEYWLDGEPYTTPTTQRGEPFTIISADRNVLEYMERQHAVLVESTLNGKPGGTSFTLTNESNHLILKFKTNSISVTKKVEIDGWNELTEEQQEAVWPKGGYTATFELCQAENVVGTATVQVEMNSLSGVAEFANFQPEAGKTYTIRETSASELGGYDYTTEVSPDKVEITSDNLSGSFTVTNTYAISNLDLTIEKTGWQPIDENQSFIFNVKGDGVDMDVTINFSDVNNKTGSVTITGLKPGSYTVTEKTDWSWRYTPSETASNPRTIELTKENNKVTFKNSRPTVKWLNGCSWAVNNWNNTEATKSPATPGKTN